MDRLLTDFGFLLAWLVAIFQTPTPPVYVFALMTIITLALLWLVFKQR